ncbi:DUF4870 domain-containing protein [Stieleria varia]|uniref:SHOCT domain-containing protein n=1 Tax=Stieleria varia TaxID=2528005 RepID=A0A5C6A0V8_9BACT|nr:DUF4870 domain-containing protein [Stieleria varia]TWT92838.1 hypothetical protein Pla52n_62030 [Stieleria varia]
MAISDEFERLAQMRRDGLLTETEFEEAKRLAMQEQRKTQPAGFSSSSISGSQPGMVCGMREETWCMLMHLSQLLVFSGLGIVAPIVMWALGKDQSELTRRHGARMMNWLISGLLYAAIAGFMSLFLIGIPFLILLAVLDVVFPIVAAVKCNNHEVWSYPGAIKFFPED